VAGHSGGRKPFAVALRARHLPVHRDEVEASVGAIRRAYSPFLPAEHALPPGFPAMLNGFGFAGRFCLDLEPLLALSRIR